MGGAALPPAGGHRQRPQRGGVGVLPVAGLTLADHLLPDPLAVLGKIPKVVAAVPAELPLAVHPAEGHLTDQHAAH